MRRNGSDVLDAIIGEVRSRTQPWHQGLGQRAVDGEVARLIVI